MFTLVTNWLTNWLLFSKPDWCDPGMWRKQLNLAFSVAHVDEEKPVENSLVQIWKSKFGLKVKFLYRLWAQGFKVLSRFWSSILVDIVKLGLVKIFKFKFCRNAKIWLKFWSWCLVENLKMKFDHDLCLNLLYELNPRVGCAFGNVSDILTLHSLMLISLQLSYFKRVKQQYCPGGS